MGLTNFLFFFHLLPFLFSPPNLIQAMVLCSLQGEVNTRGVSQCWSRRKWRLDYSLIWLKCWAPGCWASWLKTLRKWLSQKDSSECLSRNQCSASSSWAPSYPSSSPLLGHSAKVPSHKVPRGRSGICYLTPFLPRDGPDLAQVRFGEVALISECNLSVPIEDLQDLQRQFVSSKLFVHYIGILFYLFLSSSVDTGKFPLYYILYKITSPSFVQCTPQGAKPAPVRNLFWFTAAWLALPLFLHIPRI